MSKWRACGLAFALLCGTALQAVAEPVIQSVSSSQQAGGQVIRIELTESLPAVPQGFAVQTPPRIALDLPGVSSSLGKPSVEINQGNIRSVNVVQGGDRTRVVLNLKQPGTYRAELQGKALIIVLDDGGAAQAAAPVPASAASGAPQPPAAPVHFAESLNKGQLPLQNIDFRRGQDGAGRVVVDLANNQVGVDIKQQGQSLVLEFLKSSLPDSLRKRLDVTDFGTPVQSISTFQSGDRVRMVVEPRGAWEHSAYQSDNQFVLEVRPQKVDPNKLTQGPGFAGEKLSLNFQSIDVRALLQVIADFTNFNVVTSDTVTGSVTLRLKDVPWDQALDIIMQAKGLGLRKNGNVILIAPKDELAAKEKADLESKRQIADLEPVRTQSFQLNYTKATDVANGLSGQNSTGGGGSGGNTSRILSPRGSVIYEQRTNQLFVSDIPSKLEEIQGIIAKIDVPVRQVLIEARIVEASDTFGRSLGVKLGANDARGLRAGTPGYSVGGDNRVLIGGNINAVGAQTLQPNATATYADSQFVNLPASGQNGYNAATFALSLFGAASNRFLNLELSALEADGNGKIVSSPRVITADQVKALIEQGTQIPYQQATSSGATSTTFIKAVLKLEVTPQITPEGNMLLDVDINKDAPTDATTGRIDTKHIKTQVLVENGGTVVIGGIYTSTDTDNTTKVPFLGDIPYLGFLFKTKTRSTEKTELLVFITPKVVTERTGLR